MKSAICIGLNYKGTSAELGGCENDCRGFSERLKIAGYVVDTITKEVSAQSLTERLRALQNSKPEDVFVLTYSGHGTQIYSREEVDNYNEALVLYTKATGFDYLLDDTLRNLLEAIPCTVIYILDSCYSGGMERMVQVPIEGATKKTFTAPVHLEDLDVPVPQKKVKNKLYGLFASAENEVSWDLGTNGLFSASFFKTYDSTIKPLRSVSRVMRETKKKCVPDQNPRSFTSNGSLSKLLF